MQDGYKIEEKVGFNPTTAYGEAQIKGAVFQEQNNYSLRRITPAFLLESQ